MLRPRRGSHMEKVWYSMNIIRNWTMQRVVAEVPAQYRKIRLVLEHLMSIPSQKGAKKRRRLETHFPWRSIYLRACAWSFTYKCLHSVRFPKVGGMGPVMLLVLIWNLRSDERPEPSSGARLPDKLLLFSNLFKAARTICQKSCEILMSKSIPKPERAPPTCWSDRNLQFRHIQKGTQIKEVDLWRRAVPKELVLLREICTLSACQIKEHALRKQLQVSTRIYQDVHILLKQKGWKLRWKAKALSKVIIRPFEENQWI